MKIIQTSRSMQTFLNEIIYTKAALGASPYTEELSELPGDLVAEWHELARKENLRREDVIEAMAKLRVKTQQLYMLLKDFCGALLLEVNQDRESHLYKRFFSISPSKVSQKSVTEQIDYVENLIIPAIDEQGEEHHLYSFKERFIQAVKETETELDGVKAAKGAKKRGSLDVVKWKERVNALRLTIYGELLQISSEKNLGRSWAESFFATGGGGSKKSEVEEIDEIEEGQGIVPPVEMGTEESAGEQVAA